MPQMENVMDNVGAVREEAPWPTRKVKILIYAVVFDGCIIVNFLNKLYYFELILKY